MSVCVFFFSTFNFVFLTYHAFSMFRVLINCVIQPFISSSLSVVCVQVRVDSVQLKHYLTNLIAQLIKHQNMAWLNDTE